MSDLGNLLQMIYDLLSGWFTSFTSHATAVMEKLNLIEDDTDTIVSNTSDIADDTNDIKDNTGAIITPVQSIKTNTDSIKTDTTTIKNNVSTMTNQLGTISTNVGTCSAFTEDVANNTLDIKNRIVTIGSDTTQLRSNSNTVVTDMSKVYEALKWALVDKVTTETEEGDNSISFDTDLTNDLVSLIVGLVATQSGTGDPSPYNVRTINGYSSVGLSVNGTSLTINIGSNYFGGTIDIKNGVGTIDKVLSVITPVTTFSILNGHKFKGIMVSSMPSVIGYIDDIKCEIAPYKKGVGDYFGCYHTARKIVICVPDNYTEAEFNTEIAGKYILTPLENPIIISFTPEQIATIKGINTITTDTNGNISVTYEESVKHYLDKQEA